MTLARHFRIVRWGIGRGSVLAIAVAIGLIIVRVTVTFLESVATIKAERENDADLQVLCERNAAGRSQKMRAACLSAAAESASPILASALLRTSRILFDDVRSGMLAPLQSSTTLMLLAGCVLTAVLRPMLQRFGFLLPNDEVNGVYAAHGNNHIILVHGDQGSGWPDAPRRFLFNHQDRSDALRLRNGRVKLPPALPFHEEEQREGPEEVTGSGAMSGFQNIDIGPAVGATESARRSAWFGGWGGRTKVHVD